MANITISAALKYTEESADVSFELKNLDNNDGTKYNKQMQTIPFATEVPIDLGDITSPGWILIINRDTTNSVSIRAASGTANLIVIKAGLFALFPFDSTITPYAQSALTDCIVEYLLIEA